MSSHPPLPGFKPVCTIVGLAYILLAGSMLASGVRASMGQFALPEQVLASPHYADQFHWVYVHLTVIGVLIGMLGRYVRDGRQQRTLARVLCLAEAHYAYLDLRSSDSAIGSALYRGSASLIPAVIDILVMLAFAYLSVHRLGRAQRTGTMEGTH